MEAEQIYKVVKKLIGNIRPQGCSERDNESNKNLKIFIEVFSKMHRDIDNIAFDFKDSFEASVKEAANIANKHLDSMKIEQQY